MHSNGKGTTPEYSLASGLAELYERFCNRENIGYAPYFMTNIMKSNYKKYGLTMYDSLNSIGTMRERGRTSLSFLKKSYKVELNNSYSLLGMGKDDDWILDALYTDSSKVRNKLSYDLWNLINDNQVIKYYTDQKVSTGYEPNNKLISKNNELKTYIKENFKKLGERIIIIGRNEIEEKDAKFRRRPLDGSPQRPYFL